MNKAGRIVGIIAATVVSGLAGQAAFANCQSEGPYEVRQCGQRTWFAAPPAGAGPVTVQWWLAGFGNADAFQSATNASADGSGFLPTPLPGVFIGNDSGSLDAAGLDLVDASTVSGVGGPVGSLCFSSRANWGSPGIDGCADVNRNSTDGGGALNVSNNYLNTYWDLAYGPGILYLSSQVDPPMGVLLKEGNGTSFALAFFASQNRNGDPNDIQPGQYLMSDLVNGDPGPTGPNVVPWQSVPEPNTSTTLSDPLDPNSPRNVTMVYSPIRLVSDNSSRPCLQNDGVSPCTSLGGATGVGTNDQGALVHYEMESTPLSGSDVCGSTWTLVPGSSVDHPAASVSASGIPTNTCVRLRTRFGRTPSGTFNPTATTAARDANRLAAQTGTLGDLGYSVASTARRIGGATVSQRAILTVAEKNRNVVTVKWDTTSEVNITSFDIVGIDAKGKRKTVAGTAGCKACNSGLGASYTELIPGNKFEGSKKVQIVLQPSGEVSNTLDLK